MGSEFLSSTDYVGFGLTDLLALDTGNDGKQDVVFGTLANTVTALDLASGATKWEINVGDEVTALRKINDPANGDPVLLVATDAGDLFKYSRAGKRLQSLNLQAGITDMKVISYPAHRRIDIALSLRNGQVVICDDSLRVRAVLAASEDRLMGVSVGPWVDGQVVINSVSQRGIHSSIYHPYFLRASRTY
jgi:outer membrane protein assembly factor BamB